jgi:hypothetical protein
MGGLGSGKCYWRRNKSTVEESLTIAIRDVRAQLFREGVGTLNWTNNRGDIVASVGYAATWAADAPQVLLRYRRGETDDVLMRIELEKTATQFGGHRWWFTCPLVRQGVPCRRRVGKLHLPPGELYFGCRECHDLTYRSSQEAHTHERAWVRLGFSPEEAEFLTSMQAR